MVNLSGEVSRRERTQMDIDTDKNYDAILALLHLTRCDHRYGAAACQSHDQDALNRLHEDGNIDNPISKARSVGLTEAGGGRAEELFCRLVGTA
jgi:hypothetical protein